MDRFLLFQGLHYYPQVGWDDFTKSCPTLKEAMDGCRKLAGWDWRDQWAQVVDTRDGAIVAMRSGRKWSGIGIGCPDCG